MDELLPGLLHWTAFHGGVGQTVHSHLYEPAGAIFDPLLPDEPEPDQLAAASPRVVLLSNRHHLRDAGRLSARFGCPIRCHDAGLHQFADDDAPAVEGFAFGDEVARGVRAIELGILTPEETVFRIDAGPGALLFADALLRSDGQLGFFPDGLLGDDPDAVKAGLRRRIGEIAEEEDFDALLFAHGDPLASGGREALRAFAAAG